MAGMKMPLDANTIASDEALLARYGAGDAQAARLLTQRLVPLLLSYATRMTGDRAEAEDLTQEAMLRIWRAAPRWRAGEAKVSTWAYRVMANLLTDRFRAKQRQGGGPTRLEDAPDPIDEAPSAEAGLIAADRIARLDRALSMLPPRQREALILRHIEGLSNPEIAQILETGVEAVESLTARGRRALAAILQDQREEIGFEGEMS